MKAIAAFLLVLLVLLAWSQWNREEPLLEPSDVDFGTAASVWTPKVIITEFAEDGKGFRSGYFAIEDSFELRILRGNGTVHIIDGSQNSFQFSIVDGEFQYGFEPWPSSPSVSQ